MRRIHTFKLVCMASALLCSGLNSQAQPAPSISQTPGAGSSTGAPWQWLDANGRRVFSDRPPPSDIPDRRILRQPVAAWPDALPRVDAVPAQQPQAAASGSAAPANTGPAAAPQAAASARLLAERAEQIERDRVAALRAENCRRARGALATLESGVRLTTTNEKGEREILGDTARAAEARRLHEIMSSDCAAS